MTSTSTSVQINSLAQFTELTLCSSKQGKRLVVLNGSTVSVVKESNMLGRLVHARRYRQQANELCQFAKRLSEREHLAVTSPRQRISVASDLIGKTIKPQVAAHFMGNDHHASKLQFDGTGRIVGIAPHKTLTEVEILMVESAIINDLRSSNASGERTNPRPENECILHMLDAMENEKSALAAKPEDPLAQQALQNIVHIEQSMTQLWLGGNLTQDTAVAALQDAATQLHEHANCQKLYTIAQQLSAEAARNKALTQRNDNTFGRMFESAVVKQLVDHPSREMLRAASQVKEFLLQAVLADPPETYPVSVASTIEYLAECLQEDARPWHAEVPELNTFLAQPNVATLTSLLRHPVQSGYHMLLTYWIAAKISANLPYAPWMNEANKYYGDAIMPTRSAVKTPLAAANVKQKVDHPSEVQSRHYGISLVHQPKPEVPNSWPPQTNFPARVSVNTETPSAFEQHALEHNQSTVHGVSGTTNMLTYLLSHMNKIAAEADKVSLGDALVGNMAFLVMDGGHSMPEAMATSTSILANDVQQTPSSTSPEDNTSGAAIGKRQQILNTTVANYAYLSQQLRLDAGETSARIGTAVTAAFNETRANFHDLHAVRIS